MSDRSDIRIVSFEQLKAIFQQNDLAPYRARQVYDWIWKKSVTSFDEMSNLSKEMRKWLNTHFEIFPVKINSQQNSTDGTIKFGFSFSENKQAEGVLIPDRDRLTACISSQSGCSLNCRFCATGYMKLQKNLTAAEIYDQVSLINKIAEKKYQKRLTNIVFMGMGEPLLNYKEVMESIKKINSPDGLNFSTSRITLSTAGIVKKIIQLANDNFKCNLAVSLHSVITAFRDRLMPVNKTNTLVELKKALRYYCNKTQAKITFEYILLAGINDTVHDERELLKYCSDIPCKINIIEYNPITQVEYTKPSKEVYERFAGYLQQKGLIVNIRKSRGKDIDAACGQLVIGNRFEW